MKTALVALKEQRLVLAAAMIVGIVLIFGAQAPVTPVLMGCVLVLAIAVLRSWLRLRNKPH